MNLLRGLLRLWIVGSATGAIAGLISGYQRCLAELEDCGGQECLGRCDATRAGWIVAGALLLLALGFAASWVISGFKHE